MEARQRLSETMDFCSKSCHGIVIDVCDMQKPGAVPPLQPVNACHRQPYRGQPLIEVGDRSAAYDSDSTGQLLENEFQHALCPRSDDDIVWMQCEIDEGSVEIQEQGEIVRAKIAGSKLP